MIHNFETWRLLESFGDGTETFTEELNAFNKSQKFDNLDIYNLPAAWGDDLESATGKITYNVELEVKSSYIKDIIFTIQTIILSLEIRKYSENDEDGELVTRELVLENKDIYTGTVKIEIGNLPLIIDNLEIKFFDDIDGEPEWEKTEYTLNIGKNI